VRVWVRVWKEMGIGGWMRVRVRVRVRMRVRI